MKKVDKQISKIKDKATLIGQICNIIDNNKTKVNEVSIKTETINTIKSYHTTILQSLSNLDSAISKIEQNSDRNMIRFAEQVSKNYIPNLKKEITKMESFVGEKKFLTEEISMEKAIEELEEYDRSVKKFEDDSKKFKVY